MTEMETVRKNLERQPLYGLFDVTYNTKGLSYESNCTSAAFRRCKELSRSILTNALTLTLVRQHCERRAKTVRLQALNPNGLLFAVCHPKDKKAVRKRTHGVGVELCHSNDVARGRAVFVDAPAKIASLCLQSAALYLGQWHAEYEVRPYTDWVACEIDLLAEPSILDSCLEVLV
ncbi:MAG: hypothetical protein JSS66_05595 [Armatimonadetes bacterium]|nr:hypothetical protein [Armatimonadota bacterium]